MTAVSIPSYQIRQCDKFDDFAACIALQRAVWQFADLDVTPVRALIVTKNSGGFTLGAFAENELLGFAHTLPAFDAQLKPYYYSQMLAVQPALQNSGIGLQLKLAQRDYALQRGLKLMVWTFDPLQSRNAYLNIVKLGGVVRQYLPNYYGHHSTSALHRGLDTDRLLLEWWLASPRVTAAMSAEKSEPSDPVAVVEVPFNIEQIKATNLDEAQHWQQKIRSAFQQHFAAGLYCADFLRGNNHTPSKYLFFADQEQHH